jgi:hypothetical protein
MTRRWPDSLPVPVGRGYRLDLADQARRSEFETAIRARRITAVRRDRPTLAARLTDAEFAAFRAWWGDEAWSIGGSSDSLSGWTTLGATIQPGAAMGPDLVPCDVLAENGDNSVHYVQIVSNVSGWGSGERIFFTMTLAGLTRTAARISVIGRDNVTRAAIADLATGAVTAEHAEVTARGEPNLGWTRVIVSAPVGSGGFQLRARILALGPGLAQSYAGASAPALAIAQVNLRRALLPGAGLFLPTGTDGRARGAGGGTAWFFCQVALGGGIVRREVLPLGPATAEPLPSLAWSISLPVEARDA